MHHYYCSIASKDYKYKVLALYNSMVKYDRNFTFFIICMNDDVFDSFSDLELVNTELIHVKEIEAVYPKLAEAGKTRNEKEYAWTIKPSAFLYIFDKHDYIDHILWLDGDTMFLSEPDPIYTEWGEHSVLLTEERYCGKYEFMSRMYGIYNTGLMGFRRNANSFECLEWLQSKVNEWCYDRMENGLWSDQMYVNDWPQRFKGIKVIKNPGVNMTPFILWRFTRNEKDRVETKNGGIFVRSIRLILFHYYGFRYNGRDDCDLCSYKNWGFSKEVVQGIYNPYIDACDTAYKQLKKAESGKQEPEIRTGSKNSQIPEAEDISYKHRIVCSFCTITTLKYLPKCLALLASIEKYTDSFHLWICCMDAATYNILSAMKLRNVTLLKLSEIENEGLKSVKDDRKEHEYCWTLKASLILYIFQHYESADSLLYVDSDVFLFSGPDKCFEFLKKHPIFLTCHNFSQDFKYLYRKKGRFNAGIIGFKRCTTAVSYLKWWRKKCIEWCYDAVLEGRFADQKYLEEIVKSCGEAYVEESIGMNAAVWNVRNKEVYERDNKIFIGEKLLVFYHFSSFMILGENRFDLWKWDSLKISYLTKRLIYLPYAKAIAGSIKRIKPYIDDISKMFDDAEAEYRVSNFVSIDNIE